MKIVYVTEEQIYCDGEDHDHPRVYYNLAKKGEAICGYCNIKFTHLRRIIRCTLDATNTLVPRPISI